MELGLAQGTVFVTGPILAEEPAGNPPEGAYPFGYLTRFLRPP